MISKAYDALHFCPLVGRTACGLTLLCTVALPAGAQYPGHIDSAKKAAPSVRAVAVLEWTGEPGKPSASRIIPISVYDGEQFQPGGLYMAKPQPLALETGTEYVLQDAGITRGLFDISNAQDVDGYWFGYGAWKPMAAPPKHAKPKQGVHIPQVVNDNNDGRPHFKNRHAGASEDSSASTDSGSPSGKTSGSSNAPPVDPDRPTLRKRSDTAATSASPSSEADPQAAETQTAGGDPDRPHITRNQHNPTDKDFQPAQLTGVPLGLEQMIAVSDANEKETHPFVYLWSEPGDAVKMQEQMEIAATAAISAAQAAAKPVIRARAAAATTPAQRRRAAASAKPLKTVFVNERFKAYELTYNAGATLVFSAETQDHAGKTKYVTLIAQPDFSGVPRVLFQSVTDDDHLEQTPKMRLVDAVDARASNRGDLVFELRRAHDREFVIYRIAAGQAEQVFTTGSLANSAS